MSNSQTRSENSTSTVWQIVGRLIAAAVVLGITAFFTPGFSINNIWTLIIAAVVLTVIDYLVTKFTFHFSHGKIQSRTGLSYKIYRFTCKPIW